MQKYCQNRVGERVSSGASVRAQRLFSFLFFVGVGGCAGISAEDDLSPGAMTPSERLERAGRLHAEGRFRAALTEVDAVLIAEPDAHPAQHWKLRLLRELGREREALALVTELRNASPARADVADLIYEAAELHAHLGDREEAFADLAAARALVPGDWRPAVGEAALRLAARPPQVTEAQALLAPWLEGPSARVEARFHAALACELSGDPAAARTWLERALELDPTHVPSLRNAALLAHTAGEKEQALAYLRRARRATRDDDPLARELDQRIDALSRAPGPADPPAAPIDPAQRPDGDQCQAGDQGSAEKRW